MCESIANVVCGSIIIGFLTIVGYIVTVITFLQKGDTIMQITVCKPQRVTYAKKQISSVTNRHHRVSVDSGEVTRGWEPTYTGIFITRKKER